MYVKPSAPVQQQRKLPLPRTRKYLKYVNPTSSPQNQVRWRYCSHVGSPVWSNGYQSLRNFWFLHDLLWSSMPETPNPSTSKNARKRITNSFTPDYGISSAYRQLKRKKSSKSSGAPRSPFSGIPFSGTRIMSTRPDPERTRAAEIASYLGSHLSD